MSTMPNCKGHIATNPMTSHQLESYVLDAAGKLIAKGIYPSARSVAPLAGVCEDATRKAIRRLRRAGQFPTELPKKRPPSQARLERTAQRVVQAYNLILNDGRLPTTRRIADLVNVTQGTVRRHIIRLQAAGQLAEVPKSVYESESAPINRVRNRTLYEAILKVHAIDREKNPPNARMTHSLIADTVSQMLGRHVSADQVWRYLNVVTGYRLFSRRPKVRQL